MEHDVTTPQQMDMNNMDLENGRSVNSECVLFEMMMSFAASDV